MDNDEWKGQGIAKKDKDSRRLLSKERSLKLNFFETNKGDEGRQLLQRTVGNGWIHRAVRVERISGDGQDRP